MRLYTDKQNGEKMYAFTNFYVIKKTVHHRFNTKGK
jgi:hypothetical protein